MLLAIYNSRYRRLDRNRNAFLPHCSTFLSAGFIANPNATDSSPTNAKRLQHCFQQNLDRTEQASNKHQPLLRLPSERRTAARVSPLPREAIRKVNTPKTIKTSRWCCAPSFFGPSRASHAAEHKLCNRTQNEDSRHIRQSCQGGRREVYRVHLVVIRRASSLRGGCLSANLFSFVLKVLSNERQTSSPPAVVMIKDPKNSSKFSSM